MRLDQIKTLKPHITLGKVVVPYINQGDGELAFWKAHNAAVALLRDKPKLYLRITLLPPPAVQRDVLIERGYAAVTWSTQ